MQLIGSVLPASVTKSAIEPSKKIILGGLITQLVALAIFLLQLAIVYVRVKRDPSQVVYSMASSVRWQFHFRAAEVVIVLLIVRSIIRAIEYLQGDGGFVISHEIFIYLFDAAFMLIVMLIYLVIHPGRLIRDARQNKEGQPDLP
jgi:hypothetical protein